MPPIQAHYDPTYFHPRSPSTLTLAPTNTPAGTPQQSLWLWQFLVVCGSTTAFGCGFGVVASCTLLSPADKVQDQVASRGLTKVNATFSNNPQHSLAPAAAAVAAVAAYLQQA